MKKLMKKRYGYLASLALLILGICFNLPVLAVIAFAIIFFAMIPIAILQKLDHFKEREKEAIQSVKRGVNQTGTGKEKKIIFLGRGIRGIVGLVMFLSGCGLIVFHLYRFVVACTRGELQALVGKILDKGTNAILIGSVVPFLLIGTGIRFMNYSATGDKFLLTGDHPNKLKGKHQKAKKALNRQMQTSPFDDSSGQ